MEKFEKKIWLSSPTMHGQEITYITQAYVTNWVSTVGENINAVERQAAEPLGTNCQSRQTGSFGAHNNISAYV